LDNSGAREIHTLHDRMGRSYLYRLGQRLAKRLVPEPLALHPIWITLETGIKVCCNSEQTLAVFAELFADQTYRKALDLVKPLETVVDLGANRGLFVLYVEHYLRERQRQDRPTYACVEPSAQNVRSLERQVAGNAIDSRVRIARGVVADRRTGSVDFFYTGRSNTSASIVGEARLTTRSVPVVDLARFAEGTIDVLKIDVEGAEEGVLREYADVLARTRVVVVELHLQLVDGDACRRMLASAGFAFVVVTSSRQSHIVTEIYQRRGA
jgi:FkbM family methyltransferase